jgi:hydrogenase maturation protease
MGQGIVIIGVGNPLCSDDGLGIHFVRRFQSLEDNLPPGVEIFDGGTGGLDLLPLMQGKRRVIFVDAMDAGEEPGYIFRFRPEQLTLEAHPEISVHDVDMASLLRTARLTEDYPDEVIIFAVQVKRVDLGQELSSPVKRALDRVVDLVLQELKGER